MMIKTHDFYYDLPQELIAQHPAERRDASRLLCLDGNTGQIAHHEFSHLPDLLMPGDCLIVNNSRVIPARLLGARRDSGSAVEALLLKRLDRTSWEAIVRPGRRVRAGHRLVFIPGRLEADVRAVLPDGNRILRFDFQETWESILDEAGVLPLPPYIHEQLQDPQRYQTVYARRDGSAAAPTAGLHFTPELLTALENRGIRKAELTLHVGLGTFRPVREAFIQNHTMHEEYYELPEETATLIRQTRAGGGRIVAVGTTSCRVLEAVAAQGELRSGSGWTDIFIYPGFRFQAVDLLITNFHLPESTLIMLVSAFAGREQVLAAYGEAIRSRYRFFSFGDAMLISRQKERDPS